MVGPMVVESIGPPEDFFGKEPEESPVPSPVPDDTTTEAPSTPT